MYKNRRSIWLFALPGLILVLIFVFVPIVLNFIYSLYRWSAFSFDKDFIGMENFIRIFSDDIIWGALGNNILYAVVSVICQCGLGLILAGILENSKLRKFQPFFRTAYFIPSIISITVIGFLWQFIYNPQIGVVNPFLRVIGLGNLAADWLGQSSTAMGAVIFVSQWQNIGYIMLLFIIAIQKIDESIFESAKIDGANSIQNFIYIICPLVKDTILVTTVITIIGAFRVFSEVYVMTGGGPGHATETLVSYMYRVGFRNDEMGYSAAIASFIFIILLILTCIQMWISGDFKKSTLGKGDI